jgi:cyclic pyranopterin phosphate synthase
MATARAEGYQDVSFTGGEPTIRPDLLALVRRARELGFARIKVQSNGLLFCHAPNLDKLLEAGCNDLHISIHTHEASAYDAMVRRAGAYPAMVQGVRNAVAADVPLTADVIINTDTLPRLVDATRWLGELGVRAVDLWFVSLTDGNRDNPASMPHMSDALPAMRQAFAYGREHGLLLRSLHVPRCVLGPDHGHAFDPGADRVKVVTPEATFELARSKLTGQVFVAACEGCEFRAICPGVRQDYLDRYGPDEFTAPGRRGEPATRP